MIYPITSTCFENFSWSLSLAEVEKMNIHYEAWSKGGKNPNFVVEIRPNILNFLIGFLFG